MAAAEIREKIADRHWIRHLVQRGLPIYNANFVTTFRWFQILGWRFRLIVLDSLIRNCSLLNALLLQRPNALACHEVRSIGVCWFRRQDEQRPHLGETTQTNVVASLPDCKSLPFWVFSAGSIIRSKDIWKQWHVSRIFGDIHLTDLKNLLINFARQICQEPSFVPEKVIACSMWWESAGSGEGSLDHTNFFTN
jgi:hypothetical protein